MELYTVLQVLQVLVLMTGVVASLSAISQIRLMLKRRSGEGISLTYQGAVFFNGLFSFLAYLIIGFMIGWSGIIGSLVRSLLCVILVGTICFLILYFGIKARSSMNSIQTYSCGSEAEEECKVNLRNRNSGADVDSYDYRLLVRASTPRCAQLWTLLACMDENKPEMVVTPYMLSETCNHCREQRLPDEEVS